MRAIPIGSPAEWFAIDLDQPSDSDTRAEVGTTCARVVRNITCHAKALP